MGVKWTCALICLLGIVHLSVEAKKRDRRSPESLTIHRMKREAGHGHSHSGGSSYSWSSTDKDGGSSGGGGGGSGGGSGSGYDWTQHMHHGQNWGGQHHQHHHGPNVPEIGSYPYYPNQNFGPPNVPSFSFENFLQQYFRNLNFQQRLFEAQFQNQFQPGSNSWAHAAASMTSQNGGVQPDARVYTNSWSSTSSGTNGQSNSGAGHSWHHYNAPNYQAVDNQQRFSGQNNRIEYGAPFNNYDPTPYGFDNRGAFGPNFDYSDGFNQGFPNSAGAGFANFFSQPGNVQSAHASASIGPDGGFQSAEVSPAGPEINSRFAQRLPPSSGKTFSTYTSSHSSSVPGPDGKQITKKTATTVVNNNGKISSHTVHDP